jgi:hypothetical protein
MTLVESGLGARGAPSSIARDAVTNSLSLQEHHDLSLAQISLKLIQQRIHKMNVLSDLQLLPSLK